MKCVIDLLEQVFEKYGRGRESGQTEAHEHPALGHRLRVLVLPRLVADLTVDLVAQRLADDALVHDVVPDGDLPFELSQRIERGRSFRAVRVAQDELENRQRIRYVSLRIFRQ